MIGYSPSTTTATKVVHTGQEQTLVPKEREIPLLLNFMTHAIHENSTSIRSLQERLTCVGNVAPLPELEDPRPQYHTPMGAELKELIIQMKANNQLLSGMLEGLEI